MAFIQGSWRMNQGFGVWGLGFGVWGLGFGVWGLGFGVWSLEFVVRGLGFGVAVQGFSFWVINTRLGASGRSFHHFESIVLVKRLRGTTFLATRG